MSKNPFNFRSYSTGNIVAAPQITTGFTYVISYAGDTDWISIGAADNNPGTVFVATGAGTGTGTALCTTNGDLGVVIGNDMLPMRPGSYVPCKGETVLSDGNLAIPVEPPHYMTTTDPSYEWTENPGPNFQLVRQYDAPIIAFDTTVDRDPPFYNERTIAWEPPSGVRIANPCVSPYNWSQADTTLRTIILDTVADVDATDEEKALPGYVPNPGLILSSKSMDVVAADELVNATDIRNTWTCRIETVGTTDWTLIGAPDNNVGTTFTATGSGAGTGVATHIQGAYDDENGIAFIWFFPLDKDKEAITATVNGQRYKVVIKGNGSRAVGTEYTATGAGTGTAFVTKARLPHPALREAGASPKRYNFLEATEVGTKLTGTPHNPKAFIPGPVGNFTSGYLQVCAYRYGFLLSTTEQSKAKSWYVAVKIGKSTASWNASTQLLTLDSPTVGRTIYYSLDGSTPSIEYTAPISITETKTVRWFVSKFNDSTELVKMTLDSDTWSLAITFDGATPPASFDVAKFSSLPMFDNNTITENVQLQRQAMLYMSPTGTTFDSKDAGKIDNPGSASLIIGGKAVGPTGDGGTSYAVYNGIPSTLIVGPYLGKARGARAIVVGKTGTKTIILSPSGSTGPATSVVKYQACRIQTIGGTDWTYMGAPSNTVGAQFIATTGATGGTGIAYIYYSPPVVNGSIALPKVKYAADIESAAVSSLVGGEHCVIKSVGNTDWLAIGASSATVGVEFEATGAGTGTGEVYYYKWETYDYLAAPLEVGPGIVWVRLDRTAAAEADDSPYTKDFRLPWFLGAVTLKAVWNSTAKTLTLSIDGMTNPSTLNYLSIWYGTASALENEYSTPVVVSATTTFKIEAWHIAENVPYDFTTGSNTWTVGPIDPNATGDFTSTQEVTLTSSSMSAILRQPPDIIWASEGDYSSTASFKNDCVGVLLRGGYDAAYTKRDVKGRKTFFMQKVIPTGATGPTGGYLSGPTLSLSNGIIDGVWASSEVATRYGERDPMNGPFWYPMLEAPILYNCHIRFGTGTMGTGQTGGCALGPTGVPEPTIPTGPTGDTGSIGPSGVTGGMLASVPPEIHNTSAPTGYALDPSCFETFIECTPHYHSGETRTMTFFAGKCIGCTAVINWRLHWQEWSNDVLFGASGLLGQFGVYNLGYGFDHCDIQLTILQKGASPEITLYSGDFGHNNRISIDLTAEKNWITQDPNPDPHTKHPVIRAYLAGYGTRPYPPYPGYGTIIGNNNIIYVKQRISVPVEGTACDWPDYGYGVQQATIDINEECTMTVPFGGINNKFVYEINLADREGLTAEPVDPYMGYIFPSYSISNAYIDLVTDSKFLQALGSYPSGSSSWLSARIRAGLKHVAQVLDMFGDPVTAYWAIDHAIRFTGQNLMVYHYPYNDRRAILIKNMPLLMQTTLGPVTDYSETGMWAPNSKRSAIVWMPEGPKSPLTQIYPCAPTHLKKEDLHFIEAAPAGDGNPVRVDATGAYVPPGSYYPYTGTYGWFSGRLNSNGAPLQGYTGPTGTGVQLGRYWE